MFDYSTLADMPLRLLARTIPGSERETPNVLWQAFSPIFDRVIPPRDPAKLSALSEDHASPYTVQRIHPADPEATRRLISQLPPDLARSDLEDLGYVEADLLHWLFHCHDPRFLTVVAPRGSGKSALINHTFRHLWKLHPSLQKYCPLLLDLRQHGPAPTEGQIFLHLIDTAASFFTSHPSLGLAGLFDPSELHKWMLDYDDMSRPGLRRLLLSRFFEHCRTQLRPTGHQLLAVFDNCDQLIPKSVATVLSIARELTLRHDIPVIVPLRPFNERTFLESPSELGSFPHMVLDLPPPDLRHVLSCSIKHALSSRSISDRAILLAGRDHLPLELRGPSEVLDEVITYFLGSQFHDIVFGRLFNYDVRRTLIAARRFLQSPDLPVWAFATDATIKRARATEFPPRMRLDSYDLLNGIMHGPFSIYSERRTNLILNLFNADDGCSRHSHALLYRLLALLEWRNDYVTPDWCTRALSALGYSVHTTLHGLRRLLHLGLIISPQHEADIRLAEVVKLSATGRYYLDTLVVDGDYLYNISLDTPLPHITAPLGQPPVTSHYEALLELIYFVLRAESNELDNLLASPDPAALGAVINRPSLAAVILPVIRRRLDVAANRSSREAVRSRAPRLLDELDGQLMPMLAAHMERIAAITSSSFPNRAAIQELCGVAWAEGGTLSLEAPPTLEPGERGPMRVRVMSSEDLFNESLSLLLSFSEVSPAGGDGCHLLLEPSSYQRDAHLTIEGPPGRCSNVAGSVLLAHRGRVLARSTFGDVLGALR